MAAQDDDGPCPVCSGTGRKEEFRPMKPGMHPQKTSPIKCPACAGTGRKKRS